jgi:hypothetical protein
MGRAVEKARSDTLFELLKARTSGAEAREAMRTLSGD